MPALKEIFTTTDNFYNNFINTNTDCVELAKKQYPKYHNGGIETRKAINFIFDKMGEWLYSHDPILNEIEIEAFLDSNEDELKKHIQKNFII